MERVKGVEPSSLAWEAKVMPLYDTRECACKFYHRDTSVVARAAPGYIRTCKSNRNSPAYCSANHVPMLGSGEVNSCGRYTK